MRILLALAMLLVASPAWSQAAPAGQAALTLQQAWAAGPDVNAAVLAARAALASAQRNQTRVAADPQSLRVDRVSADNDVVNAKHELDAALATAKANVAAAYVDALEADAALAVAELDASIQAQTLRAEEARQNAGAATDLDVTKARNASRQAQAAWTDARTQRSLAYGNLASLVGRQVKALATITDVPALAELDAYLQRAGDANAQLVAARNAEVLARAQLAAVDNDFSPRSTIQQAQDALADATRHIHEVERTLELGVRGAYASAEAAEAAWGNAKAADATAQKDLDADKARLDAGAISPLAYRSTELARQQAAQALASARHAVLLRIVELDRTVLGG